MVYSMTIQVIFWIALVIAIIFISKNYKSGAAKKLKSKNLLIKWFKKKFPYANFYLAFALTLMLLFFNIGPALSLYSSETVSFSIKLVDALVLVFALIIIFIVSLLLSNILFREIEKKEKE